MTSNFYHDNDDLRFYLKEGVDWASLVEITEYGYRHPEGFKTSEEALEFYQEMAATIGEMAGRDIAPHAALLDRQHPRLDLETGDVVEGEATRKIFAKMKEAELHRLCLPREIGGLNGPLLLYFLCGEMIARADVSTMTHFSFHGGMAMAMLAFSIREGSTSFDLQNFQIEKTRFAEAIEEIASGQAWGCMDITEPHAGSDMATLRTRAVQDSQGVWRLTGQKIFITSGHGKYHFVIARTEPDKGGDDPFAGLGGLSMFLAKAYDEKPGGGRERYITVERLEEKLGHNGSVTAALSFQDTPAALIGKRGEGFRYMLTLMNNARIGVGFESIGLMEAAYRLAQTYAEERPSMGKMIAKHEMIADYLEEMKTDIQALRALAVKAAYHEELYQKMLIFERFSSAFSPKEAKRLKDELPLHREAARRITPLLKYLAAEKAVESARKALQIHGGSGYTKEYGAEKLLRDALVLPIYEGTSQIQSLMAMKDTLLAVLRKPQEFVARQASARLRSLTASDLLERRVARIQSLSLSAQQFLLTRTVYAKLKKLPQTPVSSWFHSITKDWDPKRDFSLAMLHAERLTRLLSDEIVSETLLAQAQVHPERRELLERWLDRAEPRARAMHEEITLRDPKLLSRLQEG